MPLSKARDRERKRTIRRLGVQSILSPADIRAMRAAGIDPEYIEHEAGKVSSRVYYALLRDRDAIKAHLFWHHDMVGKPDVGTMIEQLQSRVTQLEAGLVVHEAQESYETLHKTYSAPPLPCKEHGDLAL